MGLLDGTVLIPPGVSISQKLNRGRVSHDGRAFNPGSRALYFPTLHHAQTPAVLDHSRVLPQRCSARP